MMRSRLAGLTLGFLMFAPGAALAHPGHGDIAGFSHGFAHPFSGFDHILAMVTVGLFAWQLGGRALWLVPGAFVTLMAAGGAAGMAGWTVPLPELGIAVSVVTLGAIVALGVKTPVTAAMALVGLFAIFHGYAHGAEMPFGAATAEYAGGFLLATALLHVAGIALGFVAGRISEAYGAIGYRVSGALVSLTGLILVLQAM